jgi:hypothetical protein
MQRFTLIAFAAAGIFVGACSESTGTAPASRLALDMATTNSATPAGFSELSSSYNASGAEGAFMPAFDHGPSFGGPGFGGPGFGLGLMGGGISGQFIGDGFGFAPFGFAGHGFFGPPGFHGSNCAFAAGTGVVCTDTTRDGLIAKKTVKYLTAAGVLQSAFDTATTASISVTSSVAGTSTHHQSTSTVNESSTQSVTGLLTALRTVNGSSTGTEATTGTSKEGAFTANRTTSDVTKGLVIPKATTANPRPYPTAGSISRSMSATVTITGQSPTTTTRTETITYDGSATAKVVIVKDGVTQNCTLPLPHGRLTCS